MIGPESLEAEPSSGNMLLSRRKKSYFSEGTDGYFNPGWAGFHFSTRSQKIEREKAEDVSFPSISFSSMSFHNKRQLYVGVQGLKRSNTY